MIMQGSLTFIQPCFSQQISPDLAKGNAIIEEALQAMGGRQKIEGIADFYVEFVANNKLQGQNYNPYTPALGANWKGYLLFDLKQHYIVNELKAQFPGGIRFWQKFISKDGKGYLIDLYGNSSRPHQASASSVAGIYNFTRRIPLLWLYDVVEADTIAKWRGEENFDGVPCHVVEITQGRKYRVYFNSRNSLPVKYETDGDNAVTGDQKEEIIFDGYKQVDGVLIPSGILSTTNGQRAVYFTYLDTKINSGYDKTLLDLPPRVSPPPATGPAPEVKEIAKNIFSIEEQSTGYNATFVNFREFLVVLDAPLGNQFSQTTLNLMNAKFPGKSIEGSGNNCS
jgi:hypothetical protein